MSQLFGTRFVVPYVPHKSRIAHIMNPFCKFNSDVLYRFFSPYDDAGVDCERGMEGWFTTSDESEMR